MKKLIVVVVLIVIIAAGLPFLNGILLEGIIKNSVDEANAMYKKIPFGFSIEIADYNRSYLKTDLVYKVDVEFFKKIPNMPSSFTIEENAKHGFFGVSSTTNLNGNEWYKKFITETLKGKDPLHINTNYSLFGGLDSTIVIDDFSIDIDKEKLQVKKAKIKVDTDQKGKDIEATINWQGLEVPHKFSLGEVSMVYDYEMIEPLIMDGNSELKIKSIDISDKGKEIKISNVKFQDKGDVDVDANTMAGETIISVESIKADTNSVDGATARITVKGINLDAYKEYITAYFEMVSQVMSQIDFDPNKDPAIARQEMQRQMQQMSLKMAGLIEKFLKKDLELQISDVSVKLPQGEIKGGITLRLLKDMTIAQFLPMISAPEQLFDALYLHTDISLPFKLVGDKPQLTQPPVPNLKTGLFVKEGDYLVNKLETKDGKLILNGNEVPLNEIASQFSPGPPPPAGNPYMQ